MSDESMAFRCTACDHEYIEWFTLPMEARAFCQRLDAAGTCPSCGNRHKFQGGKPVLLLTGPAAEKVLARTTANYREPQDV